MTAKEWLGVMKQADDYNPAMTPLVEKYGEMYAQQEAIAFAEWIRQESYKPVNMEGTYWGKGFQNINYDSNELYQKYLKQKK